MHRRIALVSGALLTALVSGCVTTALTPTAAAPLASKALGREALLIWVEAAESALARAMVQAVLPDNAPVVVGLRRAIEPASTRPVSIAVAGTHSAYTALVIQRALASSAGDLPLLQLAFIGAPEQEAEVRAAVQGRRATFKFEPQPP